MTDADADAAPETDWRAALAVWFTLPDCALAVIDGQAGVRWLSPGAAALAGLTADAAVGQTLPRVYGWPDAQALADALAADGHLDDARFDGPGRTAGERRVHRVHLRPLPGPGPRRYVVSLADLSPMQNLADELERVQTFGRIGRWQRDVRTLEGTWDPHMFALWGLAPAERAPDYHATLPSVPDEDGLDQAFRESLQKTGTYGARFRLLRPDGEVRQVHSQWRVVNGPDGRPVHALGLMSDVTETYELARSVEATQTRLRIALDAARIGLWRHELRTNRMHYDARALQIFGHRGRTDGVALDEVRSWIHPEDLPLVLASAQQTLTSGEPSEVQVRYRHADGHWLHLLTRRALERDAGGAPLAHLGVVIDMTEQVEHTAQALDLADRLESAARAAGLGIWSGSLDGGSTVWNAQMYALFELADPSAPPTLRDWINLCVHPTDREQVRAQAKIFLSAGGAPFELELRALRRDGGVRWVVMRADHDHRHGDGMRRIGGIALDVTATRAAEQALWHADRRVELISRSTGIGTWETELETGATTWDAQMFALRGMPPAPRAPDDAERLALVHPDDRAHLRGLYARADADGLSTQVEFRVRLPDGGWRWLASRSVLLPAADGQGARRIGINWDVSEARLAEAALRDKLLAQRESAAKSQFLARMSHELRTPLNAVLGFAQLLIHDNGHADAATRMARLRHIESAGRHLLALIDEVLDLSRVSSGELRLDIGAVPLERVVVETLALVEAEARSLDLRVELGALPGRVRADPTRLRQILLNLLSNAIKYNRRGGWVRVDAEMLASADMPRVRITVADGGRGLDEAQQRHLFEPFNRLGAEREGIAGIGIGLSIVKALVEHMGGAIRTSSQAGVGSRFEVELPVAGDDEPDTEPAPLPDAEAGAAPADAGRRHLLYIEDNAVNRTIVEELIARRGDLSLECAVDGDSGVRAAQSRPPDLVLVDMQLPDFDGHEVLRRLRADPRTAALPCIAVSANAMPQDIERALAAGFADYWTKPLDLRAFLHALDALFGAAPPAGG